MREYIILAKKDHYNILGMTRTLGECGIHPILIMPKDAPVMSYKSRYTKKTYFVNSVEEGVELIRDKLVTDEKSFILAGDDVTVAAINNHYDELIDNFYFFNAGSKKKMLNLLNKDVQMKIAAISGFNIIPTWKVTNGDIPEDIEYPVITKAVNSCGKEWKDISFVCKDKEELEKAFGQISSETVLIQKYIKKIDEWSFDGFSINSGKDVFWAFQNTEVFHQKNGYYPYWYSTNVFDEDIKSKATTFINLSNYDGIFEFEFIIDEDGTPYFLEVNFRNTVIGWTSTIVGMPLATLWCRAIAINHIDSSWLVNIDTPVKSIAECYEYDIRVKNGTTKKKDWLKEYKKVESKLYKGRNDFLPFFLFMWYKVTKMRRGR